MHYTGEYAGETLTLEYEPRGEDLFLGFFGGEQPHVGGAALAEPYTREDGHTGVSVSVLSARGHQDGVLAEKLCRRAARVRHTRCACVCGVHYARLSPEGVQQVSEIACALLETALDREV